MDVMLFSFEIQVLVVMYRESIFSEDEIGLVAYGSLRFTGL
jgi:hypothetical protein